MATQALRVPLGANWTFFVLPIIGPPLTQMSPSAYFQKSTNLHSCFLHVAVLGCSAVESNRRNIDLVLAPFCCISRSLFHCFAVSADRFGFKSFGSVLTAGLHNSFHPTIRDGSTWSKFRAQREHGDVFLTFVVVYLKIFISCLFKGSQEQSFFLQTLLFTAFLVTVLKKLTYELVST